MGRLTTHILDTAAGKPAAGVRLQLRRVNPVDAVSPVGPANASSPDAAPLRTTHSNADGRGGILLEGSEFVPGVYELDFHMGEYFRRAGLTLPDPPFIDIVTLRFGIADAEQHYHVPLLASPWSYSTYRGS